MGDPHQHETAPAARPADSPRPTVAVSPDLPATWSWPALFGNERPVELEIGAGKGTFLLNRARANPDRNFFGIEWANEFYRYAVDRMERWRVQNVRLLRTDASHFIRSICPRRTLHVLHVYHPDPWPKRRHHKRRLFQPQFVQAASECLVPGGVLRVQTDHAEYFEWIRPLLLGHASFRQAPFDEALEVHARDASAGAGETAPQANESVPAANVLGTNFETKYLREGRAIYRLAVRRRDREDA